MATVKEIKKRLTEAGIDFDAKAKKADLEKLLPSGDPEATPEEPAVATDEPVGSEGPADLSAAAPARAQTPKVKKGELVLLSNTLHNGAVVHAGNPPPADFTDAQVERLERLGVIGTQE